jgi:tRNA A-37 threonylcarbamoyl transferase component Bud32
MDDAVLSKGGDFTMERRGVKTLVFAREAGERVRDALLDGAGCSMVSSDGRGSLLRFECDGGHGLIRKYRRGGAARLLFKDSYLLSNRPLREFSAHLYVAERRLAAPKLLGVLWERSGLCFSGAICTMDAAAPNLLQFLRNASGDVDGILRACGSLIRRMHDMDVWHADLQVRNILAHSDGPMLLDFDNAVVGVSMTDWKRARNLLRLRRSFRKNSLPDAFFRVLCEGYGALEIPRFLASAYDFKGAASDVVAGRKS